MFGDGRGTHASGFGELSVGLGQVDLAGSDGPDRERGQDSQCCCPATISKPRIGLDGAPPLADAGDDIDPIHQRSAVARCVPGFAATPGKSLFDRAIYIRVRQSDLAAHAF
jgi:hypothetical protein